MYIFLLRISLLSTLHEKHNLLLNYSWHIYCCIPTEVDEDDDDDDEDAEDGYEDLAQEQLGGYDDTGPSARDIEGKRRLAEMWSQKEEEIEEYYRRKYAENSVADRFGEGEEMSDEITQQGLLPGVK